MSNIEYYNYLKTIFCFHEGLHIGFGLNISVLWGNQLFLFTSLNMYDKICLIFSLYSIDFDFLISKAIKYD